MNIPSRLGKAPVSPLHSEALKSADSGTVRTNKRARHEGDGALVSDDKSSAQELDARPAKSVALDAPTVSKADDAGDLSVPPVASDVPKGAVHSIDDKINSANLPAERKDRLREARTMLEADFNKAGPQLFPVYLMEGATGVPKSEGRPSTDPDENMAIKTIAFRSLMLNEAGVIAVPDAANQKNTVALLEKFGARVAFYEPGVTMKKGVIYVARMDDADHMQGVVKQTPDGRELLLLGPGVGHADLLIGEGAKVTAMGNIEKQEDKLKLSTNFRDCTPVFLEKVQAHGVEMNPSSNMKGISVSLYEVMLCSTLLTEADRTHWANNSKNQFLGIIDGYHNLLAKRADNAVKTLAKEHKTALFKDISFNWPSNGKGLVFLPFLEKTKAAEVDDAGMEGACALLGANYDFLRTDDGAEEAKQKLRDLVGAHRTTPEFAKQIASKKANPEQYETEYQKAITNITEMSGQNARHAFATVALAFKDIYEEKAAKGAWEASETPGEQWKADNYVSAYLAMPGQQIPYDAVVALKSILGFGDSKVERETLADKLQLIFWSDLTN